MGSTSTHRLAARQTVPQAGWLASRQMCCLATLWHASGTSQNDVLAAVEQFADQVEVSGVHAGLDDDVDQH
jgi:hypothetical protein